jgi:hypothetical protein
MAALIAAVMRTGLGVLAFWAAREAGLGPEAALTAGLVVAGALNIHALASLNPDSLLLTCGIAVGEG